MELAEPGRFVTVVGPFVGRRERSRTPKGGVCVASNGLFIFPFAR